MKLITHMKHKTQRQVKLTNLIDRKNLTITLLNLLQLPQEIPSNKTKKTPFHKPIKKKLIITTEITKKNKKAKKSTKTWIWHELHFVAQSFIR